MYITFNSRGKKSPVFKKHLVLVAALGNNFISFVKCGPGVGQGDVRLLHQTEVADPHPPAVRWRKAEDGPVLIVCGLLILQLHICIICVNIDISTTSICTFERL